MDKDAKLKRYSELINKSAYNRTPEDAAEIRRLNRELFSNKGTSDQRESRTSNQSNYTMKTYAQKPQPHKPDSGRIVTKTLVRNQPGRISNTQKLFPHVKNSDHWSRLLSYYAECLIRENRQQYVIENWREHTFPLDLNHEQCYEFIQGSICLEYPMSQETKQSKLAKFLGVNKKRLSTDQQLCFGYPMYIVDEHRIAPLIIATLNLETEDPTIVLEVEDYEISYAALESLRLQDEEIAVILDACAHVEPEPGQRLIEAVESRLIQQISEVCGYQLQKVSFNSDDRFEKNHGQLYDVGCLFWVSPNNATGNLIAELHLLAEPSHWDLVPNALKELLSAVPEREYADVKTLDEGDEIFVTAINDQQRRAIYSSMTQSVTVVTGPPGTGKSQLVLNLVAQALLHNQSVLFASRNNKAVDVVMNRLQNEIAFPGSVRTGNKVNRKKAAIEMQNALSKAIQITLPRETKTHYQNYREIKTNILENEESLHHVRDLSGLVESYQSEQADISRLLPEDTAAWISQEASEIPGDDTDHLLEMLSNFRLQILNLREQENKVVQLLRATFVANQAESLLIHAIRDFESKWGRFGGRFLNPGTFKNLQHIRDYLRLWETTLPAFEIQEQLVRLRRENKQLRAKYDITLENIPDNKKGDIEIYAQVYSEENLRDYFLQAEQLHKRAEILSTGKLPLWERLLAWLHIRNPNQLFKHDFQIFIQSLNLDPELWSDTNSDDFSQLNRSSFELENLLNASHLFVLMQRIRAESAELEIRLRTNIVDLPESLKEDIVRLEIDHGVTASLYQPVHNLIEETTDLIKTQEQVIDRINNKILSNSENLDLVKIISNSTLNLKSEHQKIEPPISQTSLLDTINYWRNLVLLWKTIAGLKIIKSRLKVLPSESELIDQIKQNQDKLLAAGSEIIRTRWLTNIQNMGTLAIQNVYDYVSAVDQLCGPYNQDSYRQLKEAETDNFPSALKMFPIWATTNLAAKTNLPLIPELFDFVVIDEASQCDIPSVIPLLYRAKHILIIGDPNQLRHVATLSQNSDIDSAMKFSISPEAFLYNTHSLFDLAQRSVGSSPGTLLLNEHYRSDARIIEFSNQEFYNNKLQIRTDLIRRGLPLRFIKSACGVYWLHTQGVTTRPPTGSAYNQVELDNIKYLVPKIIDNLRSYGLSQASLGIVTPYREQEKRLLMSIPDQSTIIGTAHKFQGDECDVIIFSPVLSSGISDGSLHWLEQTVNLLNVSVTRPRCIFIVVGDWNFCQNLPVGNKYRSLAEYVNNQHTVVYKIDDLPLLNMGQSSPIGKITDPINREYNRTTIRKFLGSCSDYLWWMDGYFNDHVFDLILDVVQQPDFTVQDIRLLTAKEQIEPVDDRKPSISTHKALSVQRELKQQGIQFEFRYLFKKALPHDRFLYSHNQTINMPPFGGVYGDHKMLSEYTKTETGHEFFEKFWSDATKVQ